MSCRFQASVVCAALLLTGCERSPEATTAPVAQPPAPPPKPAVPDTAARPPAAPAPATAARPVPAPMPPPAAGDTPRIEGLRQEEIVARLGMPAAERNLAPAKVLDYKANGCDLSIYLYFDTGRNGFFALHYDVNGRPPPSPDADRCLRTIAAAKRG